MNHKKEERRIYIHILLAIVYICLTHISLLAQPPYTACFTMSATRACAPYTLRVTTCSQSGPSVGLPKPIYYYDFAGAPGVFTQDTFHIYTIPGIYTVRQAVNDGVSGTVYTTHTIEILSTPEPQYTIEACQGNGVRVKITDTHYDQYKLDYGDGTIVTVASGAYTTYYYATSTLKTIKVTGEFLPGCIGQSKSTTFTPYPSLSPAYLLDLTVTSQSINGEAELRFSTQAYMKYIIEQKINNGTFATVATIDATNTGIYTYKAIGINTASNTYTYRVQCTDACGNSTAYSPELSSITINVVANNSFNQVTFNAGTSPVFSSYEVSVNNEPSLIVTSPYNDINVLCGTEYCYQVTGKLSVISGYTGTHIISKTVVACTTAIIRHTPPNIVNINSTIESASVKILCDIPSTKVSQFTFLRSENGSSYKTIGISTMLPYTDFTAEANAKQYCYQIQYEDDCDNLSNISASTCPVLLKVDVGNDMNNLSWTPYTGYTTGIQGYVLEYLDENNQVVESKNMGSFLSYTDIPEPSVTYSIYRIKVEPKGAENLISYSNIVRVNYNAEIYVPNIFTPNEDGQNDYFTVKGKYFKDFKLTVYNTWGEVIFQSEDVNTSWDGSYRNKPVANGSYAYIIKVKDNAGKEITEKGYINLMR